jgi:hypothetical protein
VSALLIASRYTCTAVLILVHGLVGCGDSQPTGPSAAAIPSAIASPPASGEAISGTVSDSGLRPLAGARVEFVDGPQAGISTTTDARGEFSLTGAVDDTSRFRASKDGHVTATATIQPVCEPCRPHRWVHFYLSLLEAPVPIAGDYTLTFVADRACATLPDDVRTRTYAVTIAPGDLNWAGHPSGSATSFKATPTGGTFPAGLNGFYLNVAASYIRLSLGDHTDPGITELMGAHTYVAFGGSGVANAAAPISTIATSFEGWIDHCVNPQMGDRYECTPGPAVTHTRCESRNHQLILTRR